MPIIRAIVPTEPEHTCPVMRCLEAHTPDSPDSLRKAADPIDVLHLTSAMPYPPPDAAITAQADRMSRTLLLWCIESCLPADTFAAIGRFILVLDGKRMSIIARESSPDETSPRLCARVDIKSEHKPTLLVLLGCKSGVGSLAMQAEIWAFASNSLTITGMPAGSLPQRIEPCRAGIAYTLTEPSVKFTARRT